jgi:hypothetical protein
MKRFASCIGTTMLPAGRAVPLRLEVTVATALSNSFRLQTYHVTFWTIIRQQIVWNGFNGQNLRNKTAKFGIYCQQSTCPQKQWEANEIRRWRIVVTALWKVRSGRKTFVRADKIRESCDIPVTSLVGRLFFFHTPECSQGSSAACRHPTAPEAMTVSLSLCSSILMMNILRKHKLMWCSMDHCLR